MLLAKLLFKLCMRSHSGFTQYAPHATSKLTWFKMSSTARNAKDLYQSQKRSILPTISSYPTILSTKISNFYNKIKQVWHLRACIRRYRKYWNSAHGSSNTFTLFKKGFRFRRRGMTYILISQLFSINLLTMLLYVVQRKIPQHI